VTCDASSVHSIHTQLTPILHKPQALPQTWDYSPENDVGLATAGNASIECEQPNNSLYTFTGNLQLGQQKIALTTNQVGFLDASSPKTGNPVWQGKVDTS
jgi:hypothetical protein